MTSVMARYNVQYADSSIRDIRPFYSWRGICLDPWTRGPREIHDGLLSVVELEIKSDRKQNGQS